MKPKPIEKQQAIILRKHGHSLQEISIQLGISKGTASIWLQHTPLSAIAQERIQKKRDEGSRKSRATLNGRTNKRLTEAFDFARKTLGKISSTADSSRLYCALFYWCEGEKSKNDKSLFFTNSDPLLVKSFLKHLRKGFEIDETKFRVCVHLHSYHDAQKQLLFWSQITSIPLAQFIKPYQKLNSGKNKKVGYAGCASVRYHDVRIARQVQAIARAFLNK
ncbi:MAG TPA: helix-turn-helix domain-containing protein [Candidatus Paceibacterota bacterium]